MKKANNPHLCQIAVEEEVNDAEVMANWYASEVFGSCDVYGAYADSNGTIHARINDTEVIIRETDFAANVPNCLSAEYIGCGNFHAVRISA